MSKHYYAERPSSSGAKKTIKTHQLGHTLAFKSQSGVFGWQKVDRGSELLLNSAEFPNNKETTILDLGCGYGFIGIAIAKANPNYQVLMTDINEIAVKLTRENCKINAVTQNTVVKQGYLFQPLEGYTFDLIITNPPIMAGKKVLAELVRGAHASLKKQGSLQLVMPKKKGLGSMKKLLDKVFSAFEVIGRGSGYHVLKATK